MGSELEVLHKKYAKMLHLLKSGRLGEVRPLLDELKKTASEDAMIWIYSAYVSATLSQKNDAESSLKVAESLAGDNPSAWFNMGIVYKRLENSSSKSMFGKAEKLDKSYKEKVKLAKKDEFPKLELDVPEYLKEIYDSVVQSDSGAPKLSSAPVKEQSQREEDWKIEEIRKKGRDAIDRQIIPRVKYARKVLKKGTNSSDELEEALDELEFAHRLDSNNEKVWAEKLLVLLALNRVSEAKEHFKKYEFHSRDLKNYDNWRFYSVQQYFDALELIEEADSPEIIPELYDAAAENLATEIRELADNNHDDPHLWFVVLMDAIKNQNQMKAQKSTEILSSILIADGKRMRQIVNVAKYLLENKIAWLVINEEKSQFEIYWDWTYKNNTMKKNTSAYRGWAVLTKMFTQANQENLAKFCYHMSRMVGEPFEHRKGALGESKIKRIPYDPNESATTTVMGAINEAILSFGDGHPEYLPDLLEQELAEKKISLPVGRISETSVRCPRCKEMFTNWRPLTTSTLTIKCPRCFMKISDPFRR